MTDWESECEVWGSRSSALPSRLLKPDELEGILGEIEEIRVPSEGSIIFDGPGPAIEDESGECISEFLIRYNGEWVQYRYGWPEVIHGNLSVPKDRDVAKDEGYVGWWKQKLRIFELESEIGRAYKENTSILAGDQ